MFVHLVFTGFNRVAIGPGNPGKVAGFFFVFSWGLQKFCNITYFDLYRYKC